ncbi:hypothetical protein AB1Y20_023707 [Prymnesium parvum]|uniref:Uncharacterized protein n=1 Tax=Prymnesium parvum TaxID=97485 RepID=A0AB34JHG3_PRYPA
MGASQSHPPEPPAPSPRAAEFFSPPADSCEAQFASSPADSCEAQFASSPADSFEAQFASPPADSFEAQFASPPADSCAAEAPTRCGPEESCLTAAGGGAAPSRPRASTPSFRARAASSPPTGASASPGALHEPSRGWYHATSPHRRARASSLPPRAQLSPSSESGESARRACIHRPEAGLYYATPSPGGSGSSTPPPQCATPSPGGSASSKSRRSSENGAATPACGMSHSPQAGRRVSSASRVCEMSFGSKRFGPIESNALRRGSDKLVQLGLPPLPCTQERS